jgi:hypothetical protein
MSSHLSDVVRLSGLLKEDLCVNPVSSLSRCGPDGVSHVGGKATDGNGDQEAQYYKGYVVTHPNMTAQSGYQILRRPEMGTNSARTLAALVTLSHSILDISLPTVKCPCVRLRQLAGTPLIPLKKSFGCA